MDTISNASHRKTSEEIRMSVSLLNMVTSNKERILKPICNKQTSQKKMQIPKHEKVELVHAEWLQQQQTSHLSYDSITPKLRAENTAGRKRCTEM
jgi:DNA replication initiation complex subunit (GINS family)